MSAKPCQGLKEQKRRSLAIYFIFCHAEYVRKYLLFIFYGIITLLFAFFSPQPTLAAIGDTCTGSGQGTCVSGEVCQGYVPATGKDGVQTLGRCAAPPTAAPTNTSSQNGGNVQCTCDANNGKGGVAGNGNNGYRCTDGLTGACGNLEQSCNLKAGNVISSKKTDTKNCTPAEIGRGLCQPNYVTTNYVGVACEATNGGKADITCQCSGAKNKRGFATAVTCQDSVTGNKPNTQVCGGDGICVVGTNLSYQESNSANQVVQGLGCEQDCICDNNGKAGTGNNGWRCYDNNGNLKPQDANNFCGNEEDACQNNINVTNGVQCINNTTCTCKDNKISCVSKGSGANGADQTYNLDCGSDKTCTQGPSVNDPNFSAFNQHISGIECQPNISPTIPPPPSPPCMTWSNGQCLNFSSGLGTFSTDPESFIQNIFAILLSASGGIALLLIIRAGYQLMTSQGRPEQINQGRDQLIAAIVGLLFLIFSFVALQLIGVDILHIPGFSDSSAISNPKTTCNPSQCVNATQCTTLTRGTDAKCTTTGCPSGEACVP